MADEVATSWQTTDPLLREIAERVLTSKELEVVKLLNAGYGQRRIARALDIDKSSVCERLDRAERKILRAMRALDNEGGE